MYQNDRTAYETAKALKAAGYPQPRFAVGQVWYNEGGYPSIILRNDVKSWRGASLLSGADFMFMPTHDGVYYSPTLADLLNTFGPGATVRALGLGEFEVTDDPNRKPIITNNPCEALGRLVLENAKQLFRAVEIP